MNLIQRKMRIAKVYVNEVLAGILQEVEANKVYIFSYLPDYKGNPVSLTMPVLKRVYNFDRFPPFFEGLLPEGTQLAGLLMQRKLDRYDYFGQLMAVGADMVGEITVEEEI